MSKEQIKNKKKSLLKNLAKAETMSEKLCWQNVYFWWIRNEDRILKTNY